MDDKEPKEGGEEPESENYRDLILQQLANLESSETSDEDSYKVRLSCILEDDESESSGAPQKDVGSKTNKESEKGPPGAGVLGESVYDSEVSEEFSGERVQITDLDDVTLCEKEKTENVSEDTNDESDKGDGFAIKKLKSSDNVHRRPFVVRRRELSSDSSDLDISVTNSGEGPPSDAKIVEVSEAGEENAPDVLAESETSAEEDLDQKTREEGRELELGVVDVETLSPIFAKVSRTYLEKTKSNVKWEENEKIDVIFKKLVEEEVKKRGFQPGEPLSLQDVHIRGITSKQYNPPVPPETYLWEELKRLRERGGYPWTYLDKPPFDEATWKKYMEHVYEPINPPPLSSEKKAESPREANESQQPQGSTIPETDKRISRMPSKASLSKKESMEGSKTSEEVQFEGTQDSHSPDDRFLAPSPTATSDTTASQSKTDITSTALDTSEFEDMPVKQGSLVQTRREQMRAHAAEIQQRLRNHAGRIRNKFSNMPRPNLRERLRREATAEKPRFKLPEMHAPKISLPDRSKFKFPEKAKLHLPESSKFHLPDRSKFHLPERPKFSAIAERAKVHLPDRGKFHLPDRSKFHLPDKSKFHLPDKSKFHLPDKSKFHLPEKAKFHLPDKSKFHIPERAKLHLPDRSKFHLPEKAKFTLPNRPKLDLHRFRRSVGSSETSPSTSKGRFDFDLKSYPKLFTKHSKEYTTSSPKQTRGRTPPPRMQQQMQVPQPEKWSDFKYADDDDAGMKETDSRKSEMFEKDTEYLEDMDKVPTLSTKSSTSRLSEMSDDRKKGVLEEINPDEFFLRQKGISQDDIDMGQYLSREIREAFRSPDVNALAKMDYMDVDDENVDPRGYRAEPKRPKRGESGVKKSILKKTSTSDPSISDDGYKTYPPRRPGRKSQSQSKSLLNEDALISESAPRYETADVNVSRYDNDDVNLSRYDNVEEYEGSEYYKSPGPAREYEHYKVPRSHAPVCPSPPVKRKSSLPEGSNKRIHEGWDEEVGAREPPKPVVRRKHRKKADEIQQGPDVEGPSAEELEAIGEGQIPQELIKGPDEDVPKSPPQLPSIDSPVPPKRTRSRSSGSRSLRSLAAESDVNRSFRSEPDRERPDDIEDEITREERQMVEEAPLGSEFPPHGLHDYEVTDLDDPGFGYATVGKPTVAKPERQKKKPDRPPPPNQAPDPVYNTYPRRTPVRPLRNYSTLGPSRPPRQRRVPPIEKVLAERQSKASAELKSQVIEPLDLVETPGSGKDLQTEKVIEKMKGRPLPPPPRPPRQKSKGPEDELEPTDEEKLSLSILRDDEFPLERKVTVFVHEPPIERETVQEICTSTQTDPLPEDFSFRAEESPDIMPEFSHEQLRIQQAFLEEMKREEEELRRKGADENDLVDAELKAEVIRQIEDIIAEEKRILERENEDRIRRERSQQENEPEEEGKKPKSYLDVDADMGYASLERRGHRQEPPAAPPELPSKMEKLQVKELEVESLNVHEVQSDHIFVKELQSNRIASQDIDNRGGTFAAGEIDIPSSFIDQIVAKIPWDALRQNRELMQRQEPLPTPPVRPQRQRQRGSQGHGDSDDEGVYQPSRKSHRRHHRPQYSTDEEERRRGRRPEDRRQQRSGDAAAIPELSLQLARACTSAGVQALRSFAQSNAAIARSLDMELCVQGILCIAIALVAGFFLFGFDAKIVHLHRWDFQFPPQPPPNERF